MTTKFPNGVTNVAQGNPMEQMGQMDPTQFHTFFDDMDILPIAANYTLTAISEGAGTSAISSPDVDGGVARITTAANDTDGIAAQNIAETFLLESGKKTWMKARFSVGDATQSAMIIGLHSSDTTPRDAELRFLFETVDASAAMYFNNDNNSTDSDSSTVVTLADDTYVTVGAYFDGVSTIKLYANDVLATTMTGITVPAAEMAVGFGYWNGAAGAETTDIDYVFVAKER